MDEPPKVHHHKGKHRRSSSRRSVTEASNTAVIVESQNDDDGSTEDTKRKHEKIVVEVTSSSHGTDDIKIIDNDVPSADVDQSGIDPGEERTVQKGILGYMDREIKTLKKPQSLSDPTASPAQRSIRSRSSIEKSPRQKRSKSESRRRRERKLIAAGEMEVRQANETLMRYLKQCSEINDASLSGELEIDKTIDDRRVHRKTKSQRERRGGHPSSSAIGLGSSTSLKNTVTVSEMYTRDRIPPSSLTSILQELASDIVPSHGEIYNPFTPVISPTDGPPTRTNKMFIQTPRGYRSVCDDTFLKASLQNDPESNRSSISSSVNLSCIVQRLWILVSNICHGLLAGLALAHILFIITTKPVDWVEGSIKHYSSFAEIYSNTFYCLAIVCLVSIFDRMDICRWNLFTSAESISFRWIIIVMIYLATIILSLTAETMDKHLFMSNVNVTVIEKEMENKRVINMWNSLSLARSISALIGWLLVGLSPTDDLLYHRLLEMEKYQLNNN